MSDWTRVSDDEFGRHEGAHFVASGNFAVWAQPPDLVGISVWGVLTVACVERVYALFDRRAGQPLRLVTDLRRTTAQHVGFSELEAVLSNARRRIGTRPPLRGHALVVPADVSGVWWRGLSASLGVVLPWRAVSSIDEAYEWLSVPGAAERTEALLRELASGPTLMHRIDALLREHPELEVATTAQRLEVSPRTLQRELAAHDMSFTKLRNTHRRNRTLELLARSDLKLEAVSEMVGFASPSHFHAWFRREFGSTPGEYRRR